MPDPAHSLPDDDRIAPRPTPDGTNPEWLVSSDQGAEDELHTRPEGPPPELRLTTSKDLSTSVPVERPRLPERSGPGARAAEERSKGPKTWAAAASSVPKLQVTGVPPSPGPPPRVIPAARDLQPPAPRRAPAEMEDDSMDPAGFPDDTGPLKPAPPPPRQLDEPLWVIAIDAVRSDRRVQILVLLTVLLPIVAWIFWPRSEPGVSLHALRREPGRWDGQMVRIQGRVGEVFHVGAGYAFNLHQGRDTIVVFTRGRAPRSRDKISIAGSVSTGYLDGQPRQAIFAVPESR